MKQKSTLQQNSTQRKNEKTKRGNSQTAQLERFRQAVHEHGCDMDEVAFDETLRKVFPPKQGTG